MLAALAERAEALNWVRPQLVDEEAIIEIVDGRHPVVEQVLDDAFVPNSLPQGRCPPHGDHHRPEHGR